MYNSEVHLSVGFVRIFLVQYLALKVKAPLFFGLEGFGNFGRLHHRIKEGGHLPYEGETEHGLVCLNLDT